MKCLVCETGDTELIFTKLGVERYWRCHNCECYFLEKEFHPDQTNEFEHYEKHNNDPDDLGYRRYVLPVYDAVLESFSAGCEGLDYGAGPGPVLSVMLEEKGLVMSQWDPYYAQDQNALKKTYDFVICSEVAEHFHGPLKSWAHMTSLLRPKGKLFVMTCLAPSVEMFPGWHYHRDPTHVCFYTEKTMKVLAQKMGFQHVNVTPPRLSVFSF